MSDEETLKTLSLKIQHEAELREIGDREVTREVERLKQLRVIEIVMLILLGAIVGHVPDLIPTVVGLLG